MRNLESSPLADDGLIVTLSVGQSKIGAGAIDSLGNQLCLLEEIATPRESSDRFAATAQQIVAVVRQVGQQNVAYVGVSYPELVPPPPRLITDPENLPSDSNPIQETIASLVAEKLGPPIQLEVLHDAAAAALGEVSLKGTLAGCKDCLFIVWGTGVASGIIRDGRIYWRDPAIHLMTGEIGLQVIRMANGLFEYRPSPELPELGPFGDTIGSLASWSRACTQIWEEDRCEGRGTSPVGAGE
ncbi:ROK family protein [Chloroflexi bacterium TSY]|nr:ROK family protein [Chloroflexi bacterium TSY]